MANDNHRDVTLKRGDTVVLSATPIPGNEELVHRTLNKLFRRGAHVFYQALTPVHVSGHASREELKLMLRSSRRATSCPTGGEYRMLVLHGRLGPGAGHGRGGHLRHRERPGAGVRRPWRAMGDEVPGGYVYVDGLGVGDIGQVVLRDRHHLARDGFVVVVAAIDGHTGELARPAEVMTRGFVYQRDAAGLLTEIGEQVSRIIIKSHGGHDVLADDLRDGLASFIFERTKRRPMVLPMVIEV